MAGAGGERCRRLARGEVAGSEAVPAERALLERFLAHVPRVDPDVRTGWTVCDFDLAVRQRACRRGGLRCALGRTDDDLDIRRDQNFTRESRAVLCGRVVLDGLALLRGAFIRLEDYRLDTAAKLLIGKRKLFTSEHRGAEIEAAYRDDPARLAAYNLQDARLVLEILERTRLVELAVERSLSTGMQLDRVGAAIASVDSLYLPALRARGPGAKDLYDPPRGRAGLPPPPPVLARGGERDPHRRPARDPARGRGGRGPGPPRHLRRHRLALRRPRRARPGAGRGARRGAARGDRRRRRRRRRTRVRLHEPPRARVREDLRALLHARGARRGDEEQEALRVAGGYCVR